ncbi:MAG: efflux RND transporter permease subunit [Bacteroidota bacterium]
MKPTSFSILIFFALFSVIGFALIPRLSVQWLPTERSPYLVVQFQWSNASPTAIEQEVITPLEGAFNLVQGVESIYAVARNGRGNLRLELSEEAELDYLRFEVASKIRQLYPKLPQGVGFPVIYVSNPEAEQQERPILTYALSGKEAPSVLYRYASEVLNPKLALISGVENIQIAGGNEQEWRITYKEAQLAVLKIKPEAIRNAIQQYFTPANLGVAKINNQAWQVRLNNVREASNRAQLEDLVIGKANNQVLRLKDVARVSFEEQTPQQFYRINGQNSIRLLFYAERGENTLYLAQKVKSEMAALKGILPASYQIRLEDDATTYLNEELNKIAQRTVLSLVIILLFVLLIYRNWKHLLIVLLSLLANLGIAFIFYDLFEVELHLYALAGITVSFGILIDNGIIMIHHFREQGNLKVFPALLASTLTTISALSIIWFLSDQWKVNLLDFAKVIAINLSVSLLVAVLLIPALLEKVNLTKKVRTNNVVLLRKKVRWHQFYEKLLTFLVRRKVWVITGVILLFGLPVFLLPNKIENQPLYNRTVGNELYVENAKPIVNKLLGGTLRLFLWYVYEGATYREADETVLRVEANLPFGSTLEQMNTIILQIEEYLSQFDVEVKQFTSRVNSGQYGGIEIY